MVVKFCVELVSVHGVLNLCQSNDLVVNLCQSSGLCWTYVGLCWTMLVCVSQFRDNVVNLLNLCVVNWAVIKVLWPKLWCKFYVLLCDLSCVWSDLLYICDERRRNTVPIFGAFCDDKDVFHDENGHVLWWKNASVEVLALLKYPFYPLFILDNGMNSISKSLTVLTPA